MNEILTSTTILEKLRAMDSIQASWDAHRKHCKWTWDSLGQTVFREKRFAFVEVGGGVDGDGDSLSDCICIVPALGELCGSP